MIGRPQPGEMSEYFGGYVGLVEQGADVLEVLRRQGEEVASFFSNLDDEQRCYRYAEGKWSLQEIFGHLLDVERVLATRALAFSRRDPAELPGFDENDYVREADFDRRDMESMVEEYRHLRAATLSFFGSLDDEQLRREGVANESRCSVRALAYVIAGHEKHHRSIADERYLRPHRGS